MLTLLLTALALTPLELGLTEAELASALKGQVPTRTESFTSAQGKDAGRGLGAIVIDRPVADVWATLTHYDDSAEYIHRVKKVEVLERGEARLRVKQEIDATVKTVRYTAWFDLDGAAHAIRWKLDPSAGDNNVKDVDGDYRMFAVDPGRTLLIYRSYVDTGLKVPRAIQNYMTRRSIPDLMRNIKRRIESGGTWKR